MLLVIDTGNTNTLFAIHDGDKWLVEWRIATDASRTADEYAVWFYQLMSMQKMQINDIYPSFDKILKREDKEKLLNQKSIVLNFVKTNSSQLLLLKH